MMNAERACHGRSVRLLRHLCSALGSALDWRWARRREGQERTYVRTGGEAVSGAVRYENASKPDELDALTKRRGGEYGGDERRRDDRMPANRDALHYEKQMHAQGVDSALRETHGRVKCTLCAPKNRRNSHVPQQVGLPTQRSMRPPE
jgi:hypothetical protein